MVTRIFGMTIHEVSNDEAEAVARFLRISTDEAEIEDSPQAETRNSGSCRSGRSRARLPITAESQRLRCPSHIIGHINIRSQLFLLAIARLPSSILFRLSHGP